MRLAQERSTRKEWLMLSCGRDQTVNDNDEGKLINLIKLCDAINAKSKKARPRNFPSFDSFIGPAICLGLTKI